MPASLPRLSVVHLQRRGSAVALLIAVAVLLELAAGTGLAYLAGFDKVRAVAGRFDGLWLMVLVGGLVVSIVGYYLAYRGIFRVEGGPVLSGSQMRAVVAAGSGGFLAHGGGALDQYVLEAAGAEEGDAKARVAALGGMEHGVLSGAALSRPPGQRQGPSIAFKAGPRFVSSERAGQGACSCCPA